tara:strand:- start:1132 stop:1599 length:468 start_codon:yes stop_codon:yes gene_type:complete
MKKIPDFKSFEVNETIVAAGFGMGGIQNFGLGGGTPQTGYSMGPVVGVVESCSNHLAEQANMYETNDNDDHTAESYLKEAKKHVNESIDKAYENYGAMDEAMVQVAGSKKPSGAKVLATVLIDYLEDQKYFKPGPPAIKKIIIDDVSELIQKSTF